MLKKLYEKSEIWFAVSWIIAYCVLMSLGDSLSDTIGIEKVVTLPISVCLSLLLVWFLMRNGLLKKYGINPPKQTSKKMLYYLPIVVMMTANFWFGVSLKYSILETILYIFTMLCVGFLEEMIFRGLLFNAMREENLKSAVIVSSITFGIGHIINLVNGSGAELMPNIFQVVYATAAGFMFVMIYLRSDSLIIPILSHGLFNALDVFAKKTESLEMQILSSALLALITASYAIYLALANKKENEKM